MVVRFVTTRGSVTGDHEPALKSSETSSTKVLPVAGHVISTSFGALNRTTKGGGIPWKEAVVVALLCGVKIVIGPDVASGGTTAVTRRSSLFVSALVKLTLAPLKSTPVAPVKLVPVSVTFAPGTLLTGKISRQLQPGLMHQGRGLKGLARPLFRHLMRRQPTQFVINQGKKFLRHVFGCVSTFGGLQDFRDFIKHS